MLSDDPPRPRPRLRLAWLLVAAVVIAASAAYKLTRTYPPNPVLEAGRFEYPAPLFQLYNHESRLVRLATYLGRHKLVVFFFDAQGRAPENPQVRELAAHAAEIERAGALIFGISPDTPYAYRQAFEKLGAPPFELLADPIGDTQTRWGATASDPETGARKYVPALFIVSRRGTVTWFNVGQEVVPVDVLLDELRRAP